jgi:hypothetical protein
MANAIRHLDEEYRYPALERGIGFSGTSECSYLEILHYKTGGGDLDIECNEGMLSGDVEAKEWIEQVRISYECLSRRRLSLDI